MHSSHFERNKIKKETNEQGTPTTELFTKTYKMAAQI